jgi:crotonobetainyl-CoA:carnitine CoA-transferase CaiB-like acyl-CoA transferase
MEQADTLSPGPLHGVRVLDLTGPLAEPTGRVLADLGAEVLKIEPPDGCGSRHLPPFVSGREGDPEASLFWRAWGLGKHSVVLDLQDPADRDRFLALVDSADVLVESAAPGELEAIGLGPEALAARNPTLLHASVTPFGRTGPEAGSPATDLTLSAAGGFLNCQGDRDRPPVPIGVPEASCSGAVQAAADIVMALCERQRSGLGQHIDSSLQAAVLGTLLFITGFASFDQDAPGMGDDRTTAPSSVFGLQIPVFARAADGFIGMTLVLGAPGARSLGRMMAWAAAEGGLDEDLAAHDWSQLFPLIGGGVLTPEDGQRGLDQLVAFFGTRTKREIHEHAVAGRWLVAPAWDAADLLADPQLAARDYWVDVEGTTHPGPFAKLSGTPIHYRRPAPRLGQDQHLVATADRPTSVAGVPASPRRGGVFEGLRIADFSWVGAGPLVSRELANLGATVLRVESESYIDPLRIIPPWKGGVPDHRTGHSMANFNQSKLGLALDLKVPAAHEVAMRMVDWADVVIESFVPGTAARFGLDAETLRARHPDLITLSSCMRGQTGPEAGYTGFGLQGAALAGFVAVTGWADRLPAGPFAAYSDFIAPRYSQAALAAALHHRHRTGEGQHIDLSQIEAAMHFLEPVILDAVVNGRVAGLRGTDSDRACPNGVYRTAGTERFLAVSVETEAQWRALLRVLPALARFDDPPLATLAGRIERRAELEQALAEDLTADAQLAHRGFFVELDHPAIGRVRFDGPVSRFSVTPHRPTHAGPTIGQHTEHVLRDHLGYTDDEISELAATGALT